MFLRTTSIIFLLSAIIFFNACSNLLNQTPKCSDTDVVGTLSRILSSDSRKVTIDVDMIRQIALNEQNGMRTCETNVDYIYSVDEKGGPLDKWVDEFKMGMVGSDGVSKNNNISYTIVLGETGKKYIVQLKND